MNPLKSPEELMKLQQESLATAAAVKASRKG